MTLFLLCSDDFDDISATDEHVTEVSSVSTVQRHACPVDGQVTTVRHSQTAARASTQQVLGPAGLTKAPNPADECESGGCNARGALETFGVDERRELVAVAR